MLKIKKKRLVLSAFVATGLVVPAAVFAAGNLAKTNESYAQSYSTIEEAMSNSGDQSEGAIKIVDKNLWGCIVRGYASAKGIEPDLYSSLTSSQLAEITELNCNSNGSSHKVNAVNGIAQLPNLKKIDLGDQNFPSINLQVFTKLEYLNLSKNPTLHTVSDGTVQDKYNAYINPNNKTKLNTLYLSNVPNIKKITAKNISSLSTVNFDNNTGLTFLEITGIGESSGGISLAGDTSLETLLANKIGISRIALPNTSSLKQVGLYGNDLTTISLPTNCGITSLNLRENNDLRSITNLSKCTELDSLAIIDDSFDSIDISKNTKLRALKATKNPLTEVDISKNKMLKNIQLDANDVVKTGVEPIIEGNTAVYKFNDFSFIVSGTTRFASGSGYTASGDTITVSDYNATGGYASVEQITNPGTDTNDSNNGPLTYFNNHYKVELAPVDIPEEPEQFTIKYNANAGSDTVTSMPAGDTTCTEGQTCKLDSSKPERDGYTFDGWAESSTGAVKYSVGGTVSNPKNMTLYAKWTKNSEPEPETTEYTLTFDANNGSGAPSARKCTANVGSSCEIEILASDTKLTRTGYNFKGWGDDKNTVKYQQGSKVTLNSNKTIYAVWEKNDTPVVETTKTLTFDGNGGINAPKAEKCTSDGACEVIIPKDTPTRNGHKFAGWATKKDATKADHQPGDKVALENDTTLYAVWTTAEDDEKTPTTDGATITPDTGANTNNGGDGITAAIIATPVLAACVAFGIKFKKGHKHIKFD